MKNITITLSQEEAHKIFDFITTHLEVINDDPEVEQFMMDLEQELESE